MSNKRPKLTADKARERITSLEESIASRESRLEQLNARIARTDNPDHKLLKAKERQERRLQLETEQVQKLKRLLGRRVDTAPREGPEVLNSEEFDDLNRSFEEVRQDLTQMKARLEGAEIPRDLPSRLTSFEERISRREEVDSDQFTQLMGLKTALEQERQTVRRLNRKVQDQDANLDALREAVEDSVVATVDLAERLEELEENLSDPPVRPTANTSDLEEHLDVLLDRVQQLEAIQGTSSSKHLLEDLVARIELLEEQSTLTTSETIEVLLPPVEHQVVTSETDEADSWVPAKFGPSNGRGRKVAVFSSGDPRFKK